MARGLMGAKTVGTKIKRRRRRARRLVMASQRAVGSGNRRR